MPARKRPTPEDTVTARQTLLDGLARDVDIVELQRELVPLHRGTTPSPARCSSASPPTRWTGAGPAGPTRCPGGATRAVLARAHLPRPGRRVIQEFFFHGVPVEPGDGAQSPGDGSPGPASWPPASGRRTRCRRGGRRTGPGNGRGTRW